MDVVGLKLGLWAAYINVRIKQNHKKSQGIELGDRKHNQCYAGNCIAKQRKTAYSVCGQWVRHLPDKNLKSN